MKIDGKWLALGMGAVILLVFGVGFFLRQADQKGGRTVDNNSNVPVNVPAVSGLKIEDTVVGSGAEAVAGKTVTVNYLGTLLDGTKFDSSFDRNQPFEFVLGQGQVIAGWDQGVAGMKVGGKRKLTIAPELGYGSQAVGSIPANSTLVFEVELLGVVD